MRNAVVMGRRTWLSLPPALRPLPGRLNIVLTTGGAAAVGAAVVAAVAAAAAGPAVCGSLDEALALAARDPSVESLFVIGGAGVYTEALAHPLCARVYLTRVFSEAPCDTFFPALDPAGFACATPDAPVLREADSGLAYQFLRFDRVSPSVLPPPPET
jgi:dihydrofolate reductase